MAAAGVYQTKSGDVWDNIAKEVYGSETYTSFLMSNNQQYLDYFIFPEGITLLVKDLPKAANTFPQWRS